MYVFVCLTSIAVIRMLFLNGDLVYYSCNLSWKKNWISTCNYIWTKHCNHIKLCVLVFRSRSSEVLKIVLTIQPAYVAQSERWDKNLSNFYSIQLTIELTGHWKFFSRFSAPCHRSIHRRCSMKKGFLKISQNSW